MSDLISSSVARQNILNNRYAVEEIEKSAGIRTVEFKGRRVAIKQQVAAFFEVTERTIDDQIAAHGEELAKNGYEVLRGKSLKELKNVIRDAKVDELNFVDLKFVPQLGVFDFRAFLNLAMLLPSSDRARQLRSVMLDIAIDTITARSGGSTKYINQRDADYLEHAFAGESYRLEFTNALRDYIDAGKWKYPNLTDKVYEIVFKEKSKEYRSILKLGEKDKTRRTFYSEILALISGFEHGIAIALREEHDRLGRKLTLIETDGVFSKVASTPLVKPLIDLARTRMASRDFGLRGVVHDKLEGYIASIPPEDFEKFLGEQSLELEKQIEAAKDVMKRLKDR